MLIGTHGPQAGTIQRVFPSHANFQETVNGQLVTYTPGQAAADLDKTCRAVMTNGISPMISPKPPLIGWTVAQWTPYAVAIANMVKQLLLDFPALTVWMAVWHEPENDMTGPQFVKVHTWWRDYLKAAVSNTRFFFIRIHEAYLWPLGMKLNSGPLAGTIPTADPLSWIPSDSADKDDGYGIDVYSHTTNANGGRLQDHPGFKRWLSFQPGDWPGKLRIAERGFDLPDADQLDTLNSDYSYLKAVAPASLYMPWLTVGSGHQYPFGPRSFARLQEIATIESTPPPPPRTYTQAELDAAVSAADAAGQATGTLAGVATGHLNGLADAYGDVAQYVSEKLGGLPL